MGEELARNPHFRQLFDSFAAGLRGYNLSAAPEHIAAAIAMMAQQSNVAAPSNATDNSSSTQVQCARGRRRGRPPSILSMERPPVRRTMVQEPSSGTETDSDVDGMINEEIRLPEVFDAAKVAKLRDRAKQMADRRVTVCGQEGLLKDILAVDATKLVDAIIHPGSHVLQAPCQSGKSCMKLVLAVLSSHAGKPCVIISKDLIAHVKELADKINSALCSGWTGRTARYMTAKKSWEELENDPVHLAAFRSGKLVPIFPSNCCNLEGFNDFIERMGLSDIVVILDEADANWTTHVTPETLRSWEMARTKREQQLYRLLGTPPLNRKTPPLNSSKPPLSRVRSVIHVSATHIITAQFHAMWGLVFKCMVASEAMVSERGYVVPEDLQAYRPGGPGQPEAYLPECSQAKNTYHTDSELFAQFVTDFAKLTLLGRLMLVILTPYQWSQGHVSSFDVAHKIFELCGEQRCVVLIKTGRGIIKVESPGDLTNLSSLEPMREEGGGAKLKLGKAIEWCDQHRGLGTPVFLVGYGALSRCTSARSSQRVPTHICISTCKGKDTSNTHQMMLRVAGRNKELLQQRGYNGITILTTQADFELAQKLFKFMEEVLQLSGTGFPEDVARWMKCEYSAVFAPVLTSPHPHSSKALGVDAALATARIAVAPAGSHVASQAELDDVVEEEEGEEEEEEEEEEEGEAPDPSTYLRGPARCMLQCWYSRFGGRPRPLHTQDAEGEPSLQNAEAHQELIRAKLLVQEGTWLRLTLAGIEAAEKLGGDPGRVR